jgi:hypothetical protein
VTLQFLGKYLPRRITIVLGEQADAFFRRLISNMQKACQA